MGEARGVEFAEEELKILQLIVDGHNNKEIATQLGTSSDSVQWRIKGMMNLLGAHNRCGILTYAFRHGMVR